MNFTVTLVQENNTLSVKFTGSMPVELRGMLEFWVTGDWKFASRTCPELRPQDNVLYFPGTRQDLDGQVAIYSFSSIKKADKAYITLAKSLKKWAATWEKKK